MKKEEAYDEFWMRRAMKIARKGRPSPNPFVGAVLARKEECLGEGYHKKAGELHAELEAFRDFGGRKVPKDATLYVTLEPCNHYGKTPPCTDSILRLGVQRIVIAVRDPNPEVKGKGVECLRRAGVKVRVGVMEEEAVFLNRHFFHWSQTGLPWITIKMAMTLDGSIADDFGNSKWISSFSSRNEVQRLRAAHDAVLVGTHTALKDNPRLTVRKYRSLKKNKELSPARIILDPFAKLPAFSALFSPRPKVPFFWAIGKKNKIPHLLPSHCEVLRFSLADSKIPLKRLFKHLVKKKIHSVIVEGGGGLNDQLLREDLISEIVFFIAPKVLGGCEAVRVFDGKGMGKLELARNFQWVDHRRIGQDLMIRLFRKK